MVGRQLGLVVGGTEGGEALAEQPRHVHLRDPEAFGDGRLGHLLVEPETNDELLSGGEPAEQALDGVAVHVAEVAFQGPEDGGCGEAGELDAAVGLEALDGTEEGQEGHLLEIVVGNAAVGEAPGQVDGEAFVAAHQFIEY